MPIFFIFLLLISSAVQAAEITNVASGFEPSRPWDVRATSEWEATWGRGVIAREFINTATADPHCNANTPRGCGTVPQLHWQRQTISQLVRLEVGVYHDLSFTCELPIVYSDVLHFGYARGVSASTSSVDTSNAATGLFAHNFAAYHNGLGAMGLGVRWAAFNHARDDTLPTWVLYLTWHNPATARTDRFAASSADHPGYVGDGMHRLTFGTALSKPFGSVHAEPYFAASYTLPVADAQHAVAALLSGANHPFGSSTSPVGRVQAGLEMVAYNDATQSRRVAVDLTFKGAYVSAARNYTVVADALGKPTYNDQYVDMAAGIGVVVQPLHALKIKVGGAAGFSTDHWLTNETAVGSNNAVNPYYCGHDMTDVCSVRDVPSVDQNGFRLRDTAHWTYSVFGTLVGMF